MNETSAASAPFGAPLPPHDALALAPSRRTNDTFALTGRVLDGGGAPLAGATVRWGSTEADGAISEWTTCSQRDGSYHLADVPRRAGRLTIEHPAHLPWSRHPLDPALAPDSIELSWGAILTVRVLDRGSACEDAQVVVGAGPDRRSAVTGADGRARFTGLHPGRYPVQVAALDLRRSEYAGRRAPRLPSPPIDDLGPGGRVIELGSDEPVAIDLAIPEELRRLRRTDEVRRDAEGGPPGTGARRASPLPPTSVERTRP